MTQKMDKSDCNNNKSETLILILLLVSLFFAFQLHMNLHGKTLEDIYL